MAADARIAAHLTKAQERLDAATDLLAGGHFEDSASRAYYAAFHAATAALLARGIEAKTHGGLRALFALHLVRSRLLPTEVGRTLESLYDARRRSDYEVTTFFDREDAEAALAGARRFVQACRALAAPGARDG